MQEETATARMERVLLAARNPVFFARRWRAATIERKPIRSNSERRGPTRRRVSRTPKMVVTLTRTTARSRLVSSPSAGEIGNTVVTRRKAAANAASNPHQNRSRRAVGTRNQQDMLRTTISAELMAWSVFAVSYSVGTQERSRSA